MQLPEHDHELASDTSAEENTPPHPDDPHQIGSGTSEAPGGKNAPNYNAQEMTQGQDSYPGPRPDGETAKTTADSTSSASSST